MKDKSTNVQQMDDRNRHWSRHTKLCLLCGNNNHGTKMKLISKINRWYDSLKEPKRFLLAMGLCFPFILLVTSDQLPIGIRLCGAVFLSMIIAVRMIGHSSG